MQTETYAGSANTALYTGRAIQDATVGQPITVTLSDALNSLENALEMAEQINGRINGFRPTAVAIANRTDQPGPPPNVRDLAERISSAASRLIGNLNELHPGI